MEFLDLGPDMHYVYIIMLNIVHVVLCGGILAHVGVFAVY